MSGFVRDGYIIIPSGLLVNPQFQADNPPGQDMDAKGFGERVRRARLELAARLGRVVTQVEVAERMGVTGVTVGRWEAGAKQPDLETIERLANVLDVTPAWLAFGDAGEREVDPPSQPRVVESRGLTAEEEAQKERRRPGRS